MDRQILLDHLALAERHVAEATEYVQQQRSLVVSQKVSGPDRKRALDKLFQFEELLRKRIANRDRLRGELGFLE
jgi:hypothetical protein